LYLKEMQDRIRNFVSPWCLGLELKFNVKVREGGTARHDLEILSQYNLAVARTVQSVPSHSQFFSLENVWPQSSSSFLFYVKLTFISFIFIWVRGTLRRFLYNKLMYLAWKRFLPLSLNYLLFSVGVKCFIFSLL